MGGGLGLAGYYLGSHGPNVGNDSSDKAASTETTTDPKETAAPSLGAGSESKAVSQIAQSETSSSFALRESCAAHRAEIESKIATKNASTGYTFYSITENLDEIFYSPVNESCLYSTITHSGNPVDTVTYSIYDYLKTQPIFWKPWPPIVKGESDLTWLSQPNTAYQSFATEKARLKE